VIFPFAVALAFTLATLLPVCVVSVVLLLLKRPAAALLAHQPVGACRPVRAASRVITFRLTLACLSPRVVFRSRSSGFTGRIP
jgi:Flp pilus assembly protein protease CpaA